MFKTLSYIVGNPTKSKLVDFRRFRNFMEYISAITAVCTASTALETDFSNKSYHDTLRRRFDLLQDTLAQVTAGLSDINHPHVLSPLRRNVRQGDSRKYGNGIACFSLWLLLISVLKKKLPYWSMFFKYYSDRTYRNHHNNACRQ